MGYSVDLRSRVVGAVDSGMTQEEAADVFRIGVATVYRWIRLRRETGGLEPRPIGGGNPRAVDERGEAILRELVNERPDRTLKELAHALAARGVSSSPASVGRALRRIGLTRKKNGSRQASAIGRTS